MTKVFCWWFLLWNSINNNNNDDDDKYILLILYSKTPCPKARNPLQPERACRSPSECQKIYASAPIIYSKPPNLKTSKEKTQKMCPENFFVVWFSEISLTNWQTHVPSSITFPAFDLNLNFDLNSLKEFASLYSSRRFAQRGDVL